MPNLEKKEGLSLWNVGETPGDENASAMRDGILRKYSRRKRIDEPGSPVREGGVVHWIFSFQYNDNVLIQRKAKI